MVSAMGTGFLATPKRFPTVGTLVGHGSGFGFPGGGSGGRIGKFGGLVGFREKFREFRRIRFGFFFHGFHRVSRCRKRNTTEGTVRASENTGL